MRNFFIVGLPRSRTAWLANFLTWGPSLCFHDATVEARGPRQLRELFLATDSPVVGSADTAAALWAPQIRQEFPDASWVIIDRPMHECQQSLCEMGFSAVDLAPIANALEQVKLQLGVLTIPFSRLTADRCLEIWKHCVGDVPPSPAFQRRLELLDRLHIELIKEKEIQHMRKFLPPDLLEPILRRIGPHHVE